MNRAGQVKIVGGGQVVFVFRLPARQVEFSSLFLTQLPIHGLVNQRGFLFLQYRVSS